MDTSFSPLASTLGGVIIGLASALLLLAAGKIAGISGILGRLAFGVEGDRLWRAAFLLGLPVGAWIGSALTGDVMGFSITTSGPLLLVAGLLVGVGTQIGNGCTSGHGVCGLGRGSRRSLVATICFMLCALLTVGIVRHALGVQP